MPDLSAWTIYRIKVNNFYGRTIIKFNTQYNYNKMSKSSPQIIIELIVFSKYGEDGRRQQWRSIQSTGSLRHKFQGW